MIDDNDWREDPVCATAAVPLDLTACDREPVQFPGAVMPHGVLLLLDPVDLRVRGVSANTQALFGEDGGALLGRPLERLLAADTLARLRESLAALGPPAPARYLGVCRTAAGGMACDVFAHRSGGFLVLELEPAMATADRAPTECFAATAEAIGTLQEAVTWQEAMAVAVRELKRLTGFSSVQGVRFQPDGSALVIAEARDPGLPSYLDMRFPRADIPEPAHRQMAMVPLQYAPDLGYQPVPILLEDPGADPAQVDLGHALLRSVSVMCSRFYLNMGTRARLILNLCHHDGLWGFFACWHNAPRTVPWAERLAYQSFAEMAGPLLVEKAQAERQCLTLAAKRQVAELGAGLNAAECFTYALDELPARLLGALDLAGVALCTDGTTRGAGSLPPEGLIRALLPWLDTQPETLVSRRLPKLFAPADEYVDHACGLIAVRLWGPGQYLLGFRPEWRHEVRWAGNPQKPVEIDLTSGEERLTPRASFEVWKEEVRGLARPWESAETEALEDLRAALILAQHAERQRVLQGLLERSNAELESFAYVVSHDLQEPLRGIRSFSHFLLERLGAQLDGQERRWLDTIMNLTVRMSTQIDALLQYSRAGQQPVSVERVDLGALLGSVLDALAARIADHGARVRVAPDLPAIDCDPIRTAAVFENLIGNGIKYNDRADKEIEVGWQPGPESVFFVRDNGIGIAERHREAIFTIFRRLHGRDDYGGGTGAGLTITRKHVERQGGRLWLESTPGEGTTFFFTLAPGRAESPAA
jgi:two-component system, chemotaxis family, sensor kinase Cph1